MKIYKYKASLDRQAKVLTILALVFFLGFTGMYIGDIDTTNIASNPLYIFIMAISLMVILTCYLFAPKAYILTEKHLIIVRTFRNLALQLSAIEEVMLLPDLDSHSIRVGANGGLFGYFGRYSFPGLGLVNLYATGKKNLIYIRTSHNTKIAISPDDETMIQQLKIFIAESKEVS